MTLGVFSPFGRCPSMCAERLRAMRSTRSALRQRSSSSISSRAIMHYSKLAGDIPREKGPVLPPRRSQFDLSKLADEELKEYMRLRRKAMVEPTEGVQTIGHGDS